MIECGAEEIGIVPVVVCAFVILQKERQRENVHGARVKEEGEDRHC